jgi:hypothetical protein
VNFYYFGGVFNDKNSLETASSLDKHHFSGVLYTYDATQGDMFVRAAKDINPEENIKYLIAIRPYTISPQYIYSINESISEIAKDRLQINVVAGYIKDHEKDLGGIVGEVNDLSHSIDKSNYTIEFIKSLNQISSSKEKENLLDVYISTTNSYVFDEAKKHGHKVIMPYHVYKRGFWSDAYKDSSLMIDLEIEDTEIMLTMTPIIRKTEEELKELTNYALRPVWKKGEVSKVIDDVEYFTHESFHEFVETLEEKGIHHLLINAIPRQEVQVIAPFIKEYIESRKTRFVSK